MSGAAAPVFLVLIALWLLTVFEQVALAHLIGINVVYRIPCVVDQPFVLVTHTYSLLP